MIILVLLKVAFPILNEKLSDYCDPPVIIVSPPINQYLSQNLS